jgi:hypothetical protein
LGVRRTSWSILLRVNVRAIGGAALLVLTAPISLTAHHSLTAEYDPKAPPVTLVGRITKVEWTNPHPYLSVECTPPQGGLAEWRVEAAAPTALARVGISRQMLAVDTKVTITALRAKDGSLKAWGFLITFPDGSTKRLDGRNRPQQVPKDRSPNFTELLLIALPSIPPIVAVPLVVLLVAGLLLWLRQRRALRATMRPTEEELL